MADSGLQRVLDEWARAWSAHDIDGPLALFTDDCVYEDVALGAFNNGKAELGASPSRRWPRFRVSGSR